MSGWVRHTGLAVALDREGIDTDQLIPARFMSTPRSEGYGRFLLHDVRFEADGAQVADFPLNRVPTASVLISLRNFGSGSSREAAVYALVDFGIRAVFAPSFGDIFAANAVNNGLLPGRISDDAATALISVLAGESAESAIDLGSRSVRIGTERIEFDLDDVWRQKLINGWDDIDLTHRYAGAIAAFRESRNRLHPWAAPRGEVAR